MALQIADAVQGVLGDYTCKGFSGGVWAARLVEEEPTDVAHDRMLSMLTELSRPPSYEDWLRWWLFDLVEGSRAWLVRTPYDGAAWERAYEARLARDLGCLMSPASMSIRS